MHLSGILISEILGASASFVDLEKLFVPYTHLNLRLYSDLFSSELTVCLSGSKTKSRQGNRSPILDVYIQPHFLIASSLSTASVENESVPAP